MLAKASSQNMVLARLLARWRGSASEARYAEKRQLAAGPGWPVGMNDVVDVPATKVHNQLVRKQADNRQVD